MEHSHIFTVMSPNSTSWGPSGCPLGQLPIIYYSSLLCLGLPGKTYKTVNNCDCAWLCLWKGCSICQFRIFDYVYEKVVCNLVSRNRWAPKLDCKGRR